MENFQNKNLIELFQLGIALNDQKQEALLKKVALFSPQFAKELKKMFASNPSQMGLSGAIDKLKYSDISAMHIPKAIGKFKIISILGFGGMGMVFLGKREDINQLVAVKVAHSSKPDSTKTQAITSEAKILASLQHPNIASLVDWGEYENGHYVATEFVDGKTIACYCEDHDLTIKQRISLMLKIIDAVEFAHDNLIIHRDIKPNNIMVDEAGEPILIDFGVARLMESETAEHQQTIDAALTPSYASPEQRTGKSLSIRSDIYSLGAVLLNLVTDKQIDKQKEQSLLPIIEKMIEKDKQQNKAKWHKINKPMRKDLSLILAKALSYDPKQRYSNAFSFKKDLQSLLTLKPITAHEPSKWYWFKKFIARNKLVTSILAVALMATVFGGWQWYQAVEQKNKTLSVNKELENYADFLKRTLNGMNAYYGGNPNIKMDEFMDKAVDIFKTDKKLSPKRLALHSSVLSDIYGSWGFFKKALEISDIGLDYAKKTPDFEDDLFVLSSKFLNYSNSGEKDLAVKICLQELDIINQSPENESKRILVLSDLSYAYSGLGQYTKAMSVIEEILAQENISDIDLAYTKFNKANILGQFYKFSEAIEILKSLLPFYNQKYGEKSVQVFISEMFIFQFNSLLRTTPINIEGINQLKEKYDTVYHKNHPNRFMMRVFFASAHFLGKDFNKAIEYQQIALSIALSLSDPIATDITTITSQLALYFMANNDLQSAKHAMGKVSSEYINQSLEDVKAEFYLYKSWIYLEENELLSAREFIIKAKELLLKTELKDYKSTLYFRTAQLAALEKDYQTCFEKAQKATEMADKLYPKTWQLPNAYRYLQDVCQQKLNGSDNHEFPYLQAVLDSPWKQETVIATRVLNQK